MTYTLYDSDKSKWYYDGSSIVLFDKASSSVGLSLNATYVAIIIAIAVIWFQFKEWY